jgi:hypothetical protein
VKRRRTNGALVMHAAGDVVERRDASGGAALASLAGAELGGCSFAVSPRDAVLYALSVGAGQQPAFAGAAELRRVEWPAPASGS